MVVGVRNLCQAPGHHYGDGRIYGDVIRGETRTPVCRQCFTGYQDDLGKPGCDFELKRR
jgi:hypothetical protein